VRSTPLSERVAVALSESEMSIALVSPDPVDVTDADDARWLRACLWPDQPEQLARLEAEMALAATAPPLLLVAGPPAGVAGRFPVGRADVMLRLEQH
jgi:hypothetical protein